MRSFDERWQDCVRAAREAWRLEESLVPPEWQPRVAGAWREGRVREQDELVGWWRWYGARGLAVAGVVLALCCVAVLRGPKELPTLRPGVEDAVAEAVWSL